MLIGALVISQISQFPYSENLSVVSLEDNKRKTSVTPQAVEDLKTVASSHK